MWHICPGVIQTWCIHPMWRKSNLEGPCSSVVFRATPYTARSTGNACLMVAFLYLESSSVKVNSFIFNLISFFTVFCLFQKFPYLMILSVHPSKNVCVGMLYYEDASLDTSGRWDVWQRLAPQQCSPIIYTVHVFTAIYREHCFSFRFGNSLRFRPIRQSSSDGDT